MRIGIIAAMEQEAQTIIDRLQYLKSSTKANQQFYEGDIGKAHIVLVQSGIGKVNAAIATTLLIESYKVEAVINTGSAGGIGVDLSVEDLVISNELSYNDADARAFGYVYGQIPQMPVTYLSDPGLVEKFKQAAVKKSWTIKEGLIVTGDSFISDAGKVREIRKNFENALVTEMEGAAVAQTCYQFDTPFVVIRAVSDVSDAEASYSFDEFIERVGKKSAETVLEFISLID
ncbi:5'-methylthioadenosine/adenosylhomocysteine nucleosidase [Alkalibacterium kapii]|uniref:5'-methylthioadenosine/S-adenosylhomocysteine nucleosidase n=1 Tax=Alkalibacterium kapii TaxID=426704 RepID=A0A511ATM6_9LACT|nr:5'-methylthioadenosine/adenosylhomocysteine nucleosidase [Alkalibacterium kapii]GEK91544.1 5'-methylthioadenosine/S-adenosylhomocysteine nucleosidase [Alkalibacterium kapii]